MAKRMSFEQWMKKVDAIIDADCGLSSDDLGDQDYLSWYEDGMSCREAAMDALREEGYLDD